MAKSIKVQPKKRGRPATGKDPNIGVRLPRRLIAEIDAAAKIDGASRSETIRRLIEAGFEMRARK